MVFVIMFAIGLPVLIGLVVYAVIATEKQRSEVVNRRTAEGTARADRHGRSRRREPTDRDDDP